MHEDAVPLHLQRVRSALDDLIDPVIVLRARRDTAAEQDDTDHADSAPDVADFVVVLANRAAVDQGTGPGSAWGRDDTLPRDLFARCVEVWRGGGTVHEADLPFTAPDGDERSVDLRASRLGRELLVTWRDVTEESRAQRALAAGEARLRGIFDSLMDSSCVLVPVHGDGDEVVDLELKDANPAARAWGVLPGQSLRRLHEAAGTTWLLDAYLHTWHTGDRLVVDAVRLTFPDGSSRHTDLRAVRVDGHVVATWRDVTGRHLAEQSLLESERRFRLAFDEAPVGMLLLDLSDGRACRVVDVNQAMTDLLGVPEEGLLGADLLAWVHDDDAASEEAQLHHLLAGDLAQPRRRSVQRLRRSDGDWVWTRMTVSVLREDEDLLEVIAHVEDVTAQRGAEATLARRALYDELTGLANRTLLLDHLALAVQELARDHGVLAVLFLDLDRFKEINDTVGHAAGDHVLREMGARLQASVRAPDTAARLAGDEFVVVARVGGDADAVHLAERLHALVSEPIELPGGRTVVVAPSVGVTTTTDEPVTPETLLRQADLAMYQAKQNGPAAWAVYGEELHRQALERLAVEDMLRAALAEDHLRLLFQPIVDVVTGRVCSAEALLRVEQPGRGLLGPDVFIDVAERSDLIVPIGGWVLREAYRRLVAWRQTAPEMTVAVNVSPRQVVRMLLHDQVSRAREESGGEADGLVVEITERVLLDADGPAVADLLCVADDGSQLAIDDFGTGYSSLAYLKRLPVGVVKIDRSFVQGLGRMPDDTAIVEAIVGLSRTLGLTTVAEGVETPEQLELLRALGCDRVQGFLLGRPVPAEEIEERLRSQAGVRQHG